MSIFGTLVSKIFRHHPQAAAAAPTAATPAAATGAPAAPAGPAAMPAPTAPTPVDIHAVLLSLAGNTPQKLDWENSIVDLMKLVGMDSSLAERRQLAHELGYTGSTDDTATMNVWLHKEVMARMAANGGFVPENLRD